MEIYYYNYYFTLFLEKITGKKRRFANHTGSPREIDLKRKRKYPSLYIWKGSVKEKAIMNVHRSCSFSRSVVSAILDDRVFISMVIFSSCNENSMISTNRVAGLLSSTHLHVCYRVTCVYHTI